MASSPYPFGQQVDYHGSLLAHHGRYTLIGYCDCDRDPLCASVERPRFELVRVEADGRERQLEHVNPRSFTVVPVPAA
jgi:hypothetical protein